MARFRMRQISEQVNPKHLLERWREHIPGLKLPSPERRQDRVSSNSAAPLSVHPDAGHRFMHHKPNLEHLALTRRDFLCRCGMGMGAVSFASLFGGVNLAGSAQASEGLTNPLAPKQPQFPAKAQRGIPIFAKCC